MKNIKYLLLGVVLTLSGLFVFLNREPIVINFLFAEVATKVFIAILIAFFLGLFSGMLILLLGRSGKKKEMKEEVIKIPKTPSSEADTIHGIPLK